MNVPIQQGYANIYAVERSTIKQIKYTDTQDMKEINEFAKVSPRTSLNLNFRCSLASMLQEGFSDIYQL